MNKNAEKNYKIQIFGDQYTLVSDEDEGCLIQSAKLIDELMQTISRDYRITDPKKIAVLAALRIAYKSIILEGELDCDNQKMAVLINLIDQNALSLFHQ